MLLQAGFKLVDVVDLSPKVGLLAKTLPADRIKINICAFDKFNYQKNKYDLINAQYSLPFNDPKTFHSVWTNLTQSLNPSGIFVGQFFGIEDEWSDNTEMIFHTPEEIYNLFADFLVIKKMEQKGIGSTALNGEKFWHVHHIIAKKK